ncbi:MAG: methyltransferase family protein [Candidatus Ranarchaeia archaeon]
MVKVEISLREDWPIVPTLIFIVAGILVSVLDFVFLQHPDVGVQILSGGGLALFVERLLFDLITPLGFVGIVSFVLGGFGESVVRRELRKAGMSVVGSVRLRIVEGHQLVTTGLFKRIRHPLYLSEVFVFLGMATVFTSLWGFVLFFIAVGPLTLLRIPIEEEMLVAAFGKAYQEYQKTTKKLIPFVY